MRNQTSFALCLIGGILLLGANYTNGTATIALVYIFIHTIPWLAPIYFLIDALLLVLWLIAWCGGLAIIVGGFLLTTSHIRLGKFIIAIAAGFGIISLILAIVWVVFVSGLVGLVLLTWLILNTTWAMGLILTIIARSIAK